MKRTVCASLFPVMLTPMAGADVGDRNFRCTPIEVYELTFDGLRMATPDIQAFRTDGREFIFEEATGWKREIHTERAVQYRILNPDNLIGSPVVAQYGHLNPTFLKFLMSDIDDPTQFIYFQFGGGMNVFGTCVAE